MTEQKTFQRIVDTLWRGRAPYTSFSHRRFRPDSQGWNSQHAFLSDSIIQNSPRIVVEVGVWKGGSTIHMARMMRERHLDAVVIAIDTWLGSWEHWEQDEWFPELLIEHGYPTMYYTFLTNVIENGVSDYIVPLPLDSANAAVLIERKGISPDVVHIDGGHDYDAVLSDLHRWWRLLQPGGTLIADDYDVEGRVWPSVRAAVDEFCEKNAHFAFEAFPFKARFRKPSE